MFQWIKISDQTPKDNGKYLICFRNSMGEYFSDCVYFNNGKFTDYVDNPFFLVTHWQQIPDIPQELIDKNNELYEKRMP